MCVMRVRVAVREDSPRERSPAVSEQVRNCRDMSPSLGLSRACFRVLFWSRAGTSCRCFMLWLCYHLAVVAPTSATRALESMWLVRLHCAPATCVLGACRRA